MRKKLHDYITKFNQDDREYCKQAIDNEHAEAWLLENAPYFECPDQTLEEIYYFRLWVYRKHVKETEDGIVITEFLPPVRWAGKHNTIVAAVEHHINEGKWFKCGKEMLESYLSFWLSGEGDAYRYSTPLAYAVYAYCLHNGDLSFGVTHLDALIDFYEKTAAVHETAEGLFWSIDNYDAMEYSISGTGVRESRTVRDAECVPPSAKHREELISSRGLRPTLNAYMAANAYAIAEIASVAGRTAVEKSYRDRFCEITTRMRTRLWQDDFFYATHQMGTEQYPSVDALPADRKAKELIGYIPWCYPISLGGYEKAFAELKKTDGFLNEHGFTTAEQRHSRYLYAVEHECLWNGYIWPFATSQVIGAVDRLLREYDQQILTRNDLYNMLSVYAKAHYRTCADGKRVCWIDEVIDPRTGDWSSRETLLGWGWPEKKGGAERGKDYNHSTFCDLVLGKLLGIRLAGGEVTVEPLIPVDWTYFAVENLWLGGSRYGIYYDKDGTHYHKGIGLVIEKQ